MLPRYLVNFCEKELTQDYTDFLIIGSGIAGFFTVLKAHPYGRVTLVTKEKLGNCNTEHAQGGIAAAIDPQDTPGLHLEDTLIAGAGLCNPEAVAVLVHEGPECVRELMQLGVPFDREGEAVVLSREGAHRRSRILHAGGDATGEAIWRTLANRIMEHERIMLHENNFVVDLLVADGVCHGALVLDSEQQRLRIIWAPVTVLATGGLGRLYLHTTNPEVATGDGVALAYRAGATVMDMEFIQFHPTILCLDGAPDFLISEAVRGEGGILRNHRGERFMADLHPQADLAPRDIVARAIHDQMEAAGADYVYLDTTHFTRDFLMHRFPTIYRTCLRFGLDIAKDLIPVTPAAHYLMGGVKTNLMGETEISGLYACGEVGCNGVHGANRLASNSLLDGLVFGQRVVAAARQYLESSAVGACGAHFYGQAQDETTVQELNQVDQELKRLMQQQVGIVRDRTEMQRALGRVEGMRPLLSQNSLHLPVLEVQNKIILAHLIITAALMRNESRGAHYRRDYPATEASWVRHVLLNKNRSPEVVTWGLTR